MKKYNHLLYALLSIIAVIWLVVFPVFSKDFFTHYAYMPFLGVIAATVANTTPAAAGIVYFPILTRLQVAPLTAVQFSLIIQAYGMSLGTFRWFLVNKKLFIKNVIPICLTGGIIGVFSSLVLYPIENPKMLTLIFNLVAFLFTQIIFFSILFKHKYPNMTVSLTVRNIIILFVFSLIGGLISGWIGFGIDTMFYFILTVIFRINPAASIVTSISIMAVVSLVGTILNVLFNEVPLALWYSAIPGVTVAGLFLAAYLAVKVGAKNVLMIFTILLSIDFFMALWTQNTVPMSLTLRMVITDVLVVYLLVVHVKIFKQSYDEIETNLGRFHHKQIEELL